MSKRLLVRDQLGERERLLVGTMTVGRDTRCDISDADPLLSRRHAEFVCRPDSLVVRDLNSRNGISVNGVKVQEAVLRPGDVIKIARLVMTYLGDLTAVRSSPPSSPALDRVRTPDTDKVRPRRRACRASAASPRKTIGPGWWLEPVRRAPRDPTRWPWRGSHRRPCARADVRAFDRGADSRRGPHAAVVRQEEIKTDTPMLPLSALGAARPTPPASIPALSPTPPVHSMSCRWNSGRGRSSRRRRTCPSHRRRAAAGSSSRPSDWRSWRSRSRRFPWSSG